MGILTGGPGSTGKNRPLSLILSFISIQDTDGCTIMSMLGFLSVIHSKRLKTYVQKPYSSG